MDWKPKRILANLLLSVGLILIFVHYQNCPAPGGSGLVVPSENTKTCPDGSKVPKTELCPDPGPSVTPTPTNPPGSTATPSPTSTPAGDLWPTINSEATGYWGGLVIKDAVSGVTYTTALEGNPAMDTVANYSAAQTRAFNYFISANDRLRSICSAHSDRTVQVTIRSRVFTFDNGSPAKLRLGEDFFSLDSVNIPCNPVPDIGDGGPYSTHSCLIGIVLEPNYSNIAQYPGPTVTTNQSVANYSECFDLLKSKATAACAGDTTKRISAQFRYISVNDKWTKIDRNGNVNASFNYFGIKCNF